MTLEYITLAVYFAFLLLLGAIFAKFNKNLSDFTRGGAQLPFIAGGVPMGGAGSCAIVPRGGRR